MLLVLVSVVGVLAVIEGLLLASFIPVRLVPVWIRLPAMLSVLPVVWFTTRWANKKLKALEKRRTDIRRGAAGEVLVGQVLADLPREFRVINDLTTPYGNLDHVVIGPPGVFILDTKNWRGVVSADGKGELLLNGRPTDKCEVKQFIARMLSVRDRVLVLAQGINVFYEALLVFTAARVEAKWGSTGSVTCIRDDQLHQYIVEYKARRRLKADEVTSVAQAFLALARMDREFRGASAPPIEVAPSG